MTIAEAIAKFGSEAVVRYRKVADLEQDSDMPETFLGNFIAPRLYEELEFHARVEQSYHKTAQDADVQRAVTLTEREWNGNADITVYQRGQPVAIVELKKFDDGKNPADIVNDQEKVRKFAPICQIEGYLGVFVTDVRDGRKSAERIAELNRALGQDPAAMSEPTPSADGKWHWRIAVWEVPS